MKFFERIRAAFQTFRSHPRSPSNWLVELFGGSTSSAGVRVNSTTAMQLSAVYASVRVISETVASLPVGLFKREDRGRSPALEHPAWRLLHSSPNPEQTALEFVEMLTAHAALRGNGFAKIIFNNRLQAVEMWPMHPDRIRILRTPSGSLAYEYTPVDGKKEVLLAEEVLHLRGLTDGGAWAMSPILVQKEMLGGALATQTYGHRFFANDATPGGVLEHPNKLSDDAHARLKKSWVESHQGAGNSRKPAILEEGLKFTTMGLNPEEAQFLETRKFGRSEIASIFRVPPHLIGDLERATFSNVEQQSIDFAQHTIRPWVKRWEQVLDMKVLPGSQGITNFFKFNLNALLRGDVKTRALMYRTGRQWGWLSANDVRELEDMNPLPSEVGDIYLSPLNMIPAEQSGDVLDDDPGDGGVPGDGGDPPNPRNMRALVNFDRVLVPHKNGKTQETAK